MQLLRYVTYAVRWLGKAGLGKPSRTRSIKADRISTAVPLVHFTQNHSTAIHRNSERVLLFSVRLLYSTIDQHDSCKTVRSCGKLLIFFTCMLCYAQLVSIILLHIAGTQHFLYFLSKCDTAHSCIKYKCVLPNKNCFQQY